jgi:polar amino acid transport system substrate-binding protein
MRMKKRNFIAMCLGFLILLTSALVHAQYPPLRVAVVQFLPPYVMRGMNNELDGFDIGLMNYVCKTIQRDCIYTPMPIDQILTSVANHDTDVGIGALTITLVRYKIVNFSIPYMLSESRFLGTKASTTTPILQQLTQSKKIGVTSGSVFAQEMQLLSQMNSQVIPYNNNEDLIDALINGSIDLALVDNSTALYWQNYSSGTLFAIGKPFTFGFGLGIAINRDETQLNEAINTAILDYEKTPEFKQLYYTYFGGL